MQKERRQLSIEIIRCDGFVSMPATAQALYLQLIMSCDDEGFTSSGEMCKFLAHASDEDERILNERNFIYQFNSRNRKVTLIKHWRKNNWIANGKIVKSSFSERSKVYIKDNGNYTLDPLEGRPLDDTSAASKQPSDSRPTADRLPTDCRPTADPLPNDKKRKKQRKKPIQSNPTQSNPIQSNPIEPSKPVLTSLKQPVLVAILRGYGFISEEEADDPQWDDLMDTFVKEHGLVDTKVKLKFVLDGHSHTVRKGEDAQGKPTFGKAFDHDDYAIGNKYCWLSTALDENFARFSKEEGEDNELF